MTREEFRKLTSKITLLDGATGSRLIAAGMPKGVCTEQWITEHKEVLTGLQREYVAAGSQIIYAPTFSANPISLAKHGLADRVGELNRTLVAYSKEAAEGKAYVAGDLTTTGEMLEPFGDLTYEEALEAYKIQIGHLAEAGADLLVAETLFSVEEACAAVRAAREVCELPVMCTMTVDASGNFFIGGNIVDAVKRLEEAGADAVGVNCSVGPDQLAEVVAGAVQAVSLPVIAKPNAGVPVTGPDGEAVYRMSPEEFAGHMETLKKSGARIIGGCCGTTPEFIAALAARID